MSQAGESGERTGGPASGRDKEKARLKEKIEQKNKELRQKEGHLKDLVNQFVSLKQLLGRNQRPEYEAETDKQERIYLPFVIGLCPPALCLPGALSAPQLAAVLLCMRDSCSIVA
jgi:hypothetical protein